MLTYETYKGTTLRFLNIYSEKVLGIIRPIETERYYNQMLDSNVFQNININKEKKLFYYPYKDFHINFINFGDLSNSPTYHNYMKKLSFKLNKGYEMLDNYYPIFVGEVCLEINFGKYYKKGKLYCVPIYKNHKIIHNISSWKFRNKSEEYIRVNNIQNEVSDFEFMEECFYETFDSDFYFIDKDLKEVNENSKVAKDFNELPYYKNELLKQLESASDAYTYSFISNQKKNKKYLRIEPVGFLITKKNIYTSGMY